MNCCQKLLFLPVIPSFICKLQQMRERIKAKIQIYISYKISKICYVSKVLSLQKKKYKNDPDLKEFILKYSYIFLTVQLLGLFVFLPQYTIKKISSL